MERLKTAVEHSYRKDECHRKNRVEILRRIAGKWYGESSSKLTIPLPLMRMALNVITRLVAAHNPRASVTTFIPSWRSKAFDLKLALNWLYERLGFRDTLQECLADAMISMGIVKVGMRAGPSYEYNGESQTAGVPFCERVSPDDFVYDSSARDPKHWAFCGNYYDVPLDWVKENGAFSKKARDSLQADNAGQTASDDNQARDIGRGQDRGDNDFEEHVRLVDIFVPRHGIILTMPDDDAAWTTPLKVIQWKGPDPYELLRLDRLPDNIMGLGPLTTLRDADEAANIAARKLIRQANRQKSVVGVQGGASEDGERIMKSYDGQMIRIDNPAAARQFDFGGPSQTVNAVMLQMQDLFDRYGGNLSALGGLAPQAATLGQDELLSGSASKQIEDYRAKTISFVREISYALAWHVWHDPVMEVPLTRKIDIPGSSPIEIPFKWGPMQRTGDFLRYNIEIEPYSMQYSSPSQKAQALIQILTQVVIPTLPMSQQQGGQLDMQYILTTLGEYLNMPEISQAMVFTAPASVGGDRREMGDEIPMKSPVSSRTYTRVGRPGQGAAGGGQNAVNQMMSAGNQQAMALMRSNGG